MKFEFYYLLDSNPCDARVFYINIILIVHSILCYETTAKTNNKKCKNYTNL